MTQYADYDYYLNDYLHGEDAMSKDDFDFSPSEPPRLLSGTHSAELKK